MSNALMPGQSASFNDLNLNLRDFLKWKAANIAISAIEEYINRGTIFGKASTTLPKEPSIEEIYEWIEPNLRDEIELNLHAICFKAKDEHFEDGMVSDFSQDLENLTNEFLSGGIAVFNENSKLNKINLGVLTEALKILGKIENAETHENRLQFLINHLNHDFPLVRDAAGIGLNYLDDPKAISILRIAIQKEVKSSIKSNLELVVQELLDR